MSPLLVWSLSLSHSLLRFFYLFIMPSVPLCHFGHVIFPFPYSSEIWKFDLGKLGKLKSHASIAWSLICILEDNVWSFEYDKLLCIQQSWISHTVYKQSKCKMNQPEYDAYKVRINFKSYVLLSNFQIQRNAVLSH